MKFHKQRFRHNPDNGIYGDCHRTAIACLLDLEPEEVPHFAQDHWTDGDAFDRAVRAFVRSKGYEMAGVAWTCPTIEDFFKSMAVSSPGICYLLSGRSSNGTNHTVIACGGEIVHDPALDDSGIVGPLVEDECYIVQWLIPLRLCATSFSVAREKAA